MTDLSLCGWVRPFEWFGGVVNAPQMDLQLVIKSAAPVLLSPHRPSRMWAKGTYGYWIHRKQKQLVLQTGLAGEYQIFMSISWSRMQWSHFFGMTSALLFTQRHLKGYIPGQSLTLEPLLRPFIQRKQRVCCDWRPPLWSSGQNSWLQNGDVLCFLWGTNWIYICYVEESRPPLWSSGQSSWLENGDVLCFL
jgi:hypothetical protein